MHLSVGYIYEQKILHQERRRLHLPRNQDFFSLCSSFFEQIVSTAYDHFCFAATFSWCASSCQEIVHSFLLCFSGNVNIPILHIFNVQISFGTLWSSTFLGLPLLVVDFVDAINYVVNHFFSVDFCTHILAAEDFKMAQSFAMSR